MPTQPVPYPAPYAPGGTAPLTYAAPPPDGLGGTLPPGTPLMGAPPGNYQQGMGPPMQQREQGAPVYVNVPSIEEQGQPLMATMRQEQILPGQVRQQFVEIPIEEVQETYVDVPEVQVVEKVVEVPQVMQRTVEQIVEQVIHIPKIMVQE